MIAFMGALISICLAWIAFQQWVIARIKLNHDLFDRRFDAFVAVDNFLVSCINENSNDDEKKRNFLDGTRSAPFIFGDDINTFIIDIWKYSVKLNSNRNLMNKSINAENENYTREYHSSYQMLISMYERRVEVFRESMDLTRAKPHTVPHILPQAIDRRTTREKSGSPSAGNAMTPTT